MSGAARGKAQICVQVDKERAAFIIARANRLGWKPTHYANAIVALWFDQGCPAVSKAEACVLQHLCSRPL
jgi:hypothetical protein